MLPLILGIYIIIKWIGAWSIFHGVISAFLFTGICSFAVVVFVSSVVGKPGVFRLISLAVGSGEASFTSLLAPLLWAVFIILYMLGLVDWLVAFNILDDNRGYIVSHETPSILDVILLVIAIYMFISSMVSIKKSVSSFFEN